MTILKSQEIKGLLGNKEVSTVTYNFSVNEGFLGESESYHKDYFKRQLFGTADGEINAIYYGHYDENNKPMLKVEFTVTTELLKEVLDAEGKADLVALHDLLMNGAVEVLEPLSVSELTKFAAEGKNTFMVAESTFFFNYTLAEQKISISNRIFGTDIFSDSQFEIQPELKKSPLKEHYYVRVVINNLQKVVDKFIRKQLLLQVVNSEISIDYPEYERLEMSFDNDDIVKYQKQSEIAEEWNRPVKHLVEVAFFDLQRDDTPLQEVIQNYIYDDIRQTRDVYITFEPVAVNPLTKGVIFKVDGHIRF